MRPVIGFNSRRLGHRSGCSRRQRSAPRWLLPLLVAAALPAASCGLGSGGDGIATAPAVTLGGEPTTSATVAPPASAGVTPGAVAASGEDTGEAAVEQAADPGRVRIPAIGVDASIVPLGLRADGSIEVPEDFGQTGWWVDGPEPGETGPAVILGHVDSRQGPAVFFNLSELAAGDTIHVDRLDGTTVTYVVDRIEQHAKTAFPTEAVYGDTAEPVLRLVTCGGDFDRDRRSYDDNVIVFARLQA